MVQAHLSCLIVAVFASMITAMHLPYEVLDTIVELSDIDDYKDLNRVNVSDDRGPTRPIYRLDLDPEYIAYYEIDTGSEYIVLSSGRKTGDFREVESGPDPRPTDVVLQQAHENGQKCAKFYRLSPLGLIICKNDKGTVVAASYNWTADVAEVGLLHYKNIIDLRGYVPPSFLYLWSKLSSPEVGSLFCQVTFHYISYLDIERQNS